jgi:hypothetical protein
VTELKRREAIRRLLGVGLATASTAELAEAFAAERAAQDAGSGPAREPRFFSSEEYGVLSRLVSLIIPTDETPGAREAGVAEWIDFLLGASDASRQRLYREGLGRLTRQRVAFAELADAAQEQALRELEASHPEFFQALKEDTVFGFYTSEVGLRELNWGGHGFHGECPGCAHPEHLAWTPIPNDADPGLQK